ncbi:hypothetical protein VNO77_19662 [Canavalia gladiata]|uniref:Uncharacterized protein n=1 Tax=Canavalia gladiata TaxID=3824 RepID=A0AAN9LT01_CANGL
MPTEKVLFLKLYSVWPSMNPHFCNVRIGYHGTELPTCGQVNSLLQPRNTMDPPTQRHDVFSPALGSKVPPPSQRDLSYS